MSRIDIKEWFDYKDDEEFVKRTNIEWPIVITVSFLIAFVAHLMLAFAFNYFHTLH